MAFENLENTLLVILDQLSFSQLLKKIYYVVKRYMIFIFGGFIGWLILIGITALTVNSLQVRPFIGYFFGLVAAIIFTFSYHRYITFKKKTNWSVRFMKFVPLEGTVSAFNWALFYIVTEFLGLDSGLNYTIASFLITWSISVINFCLNRFWVFRH